MQRLLAYNCQSTYIRKLYTIQLLEVFYEYLKKHRPYSSINIIALSICIVSFQTTKIGVLKSMYIKQTMFG